MERARAHATTIVNDFGLAPIGFESPKSKTTTLTLVSTIDLLALTKDIELAYSEFGLERSLFGAAAGRIDVQILSSLYFSRGAAALGAKPGLSPSVTAHLRRLIAHLSMANDLMIYGYITAATAAQAQAVNARSNVIIGALNSGYEVTAAGAVAPLSLSSIFSSDQQPPLSTQTVFASVPTGGALLYELAGVSVTVGGKSVPLIYVSAQRVSFYVSGEVGIGVAEVLVTTQDGYVSRGIATIAANSFRIMTGSLDGTGPAVAMNAMRENGGSLDVMTPENFGSDKRTRLRIFATGLSGSAMNSNLGNDLVVNGVPRPNLAESVMIQARLTDGRVFGLPVEFAGWEGTLLGLDQLNVVLLPELAGAGVVELTLFINGRGSNSPTIQVR